MKKTVWAIMEKSKPRKLVGQIGNAIDGIFFTTREEAEEEQGWFSTPHECEIVKIQFFENPPVFDKNKASPCVHKNIGTSASGYTCGKCKQIIT